MSRVLVVSKTRMRGDHVCVGGHDLDEGMRSLRLLLPDGTNMPADTRFEIGHVNRIEPKTLVRVSLARPWSPSNAPAGLYLQISGWYAE